MAPRNQSTPALLAQLLERSEHHGKQLDEIKTGLAKMDERHDTRFGKVEGRLTTVEDQASESKGARRLGYALSSIFGGVITTIASYVLGR